jgi:hypothetical protein
MWTKVGALSLMTDAGVPRRAMNLRKARRVSGTAMDSTNSKWMALVEAQVNRRTYRFLETPTNSGPKKSTPTWEKQRE